MPKRTKATPEAPEEEVGDEARYRIGMVAKKTGIAAHTLRAWERRYGLASAGRMTGGGRLYSEREVARFCLLKQLTDQGHAIGSIAALSDGELSRMLCEDGRADPFGRADVSGLEATGTDRLRERFLAAILAFDVNSAVRVLSHAALVLGPKLLVVDLLGPLFEEIGDRWERGELSVAHEHAASAILRSELGTLLRGMNVVSSEGTVVAVTLPNEQHEFGALLAALFCAAHGHRVVYLGANLPVADIVQATREVRARFVLVSMVNEPDRSTKQELLRLRDALPRAAVLYVGGRGIEAEKKWLKASGIQAIRSLSELEAVLAR